MTDDFFRRSPRTPTTGYFLATLQVAEVSQPTALCEPWVNPPQVIKPRRGDRDRADQRGPCYQLSVAASRLSAYN